MIFYWESFVPCFVFIKERGNKLFRVEYFKKWSKVRPHDQQINKDHLLSSSKKVYLLKSIGVNKEATLAWFTDRAFDWQTGEKQWSLCFDKGVIKTNTVFFIFIRIEYLYFLSPIQNGLMHLFFIKVPTNF